MNKQRVERLMRKFAEDCRRENLDGLIAVGDSEQGGGLIFGFDPDILLALHAELGRQLKEVNHESRDH